MANIKSQEFMEPFRLEAIRFLSTLNEEDLQPLADYEFDEELDLMWVQYGLYVDSLVNSKNFSFDKFAQIVSLYMIVEMLQKAGFYAASYNYIGEGVVPEHIDSELCSDVVLARVLIPVSETSAKFTGFSIDLETGKEEFVEDLEIKDMPIYLNPVKPHSLKQEDAMGHYIIADAIKGDASSDAILEYKRYAVTAYS